jgi:hypothetical protein
LEDAAMKDDDWLIVRVQQKLARRFKDKVPAQALACLYSSSGGVGGTGNIAWERT